jgi:glyoxylase-like metal-dependent hydrolase (beta-lactamase superfamily II)
MDPRGVVPSESLRVGDVEVIALTDDLREGPWSMAEAFPNVPEGERAAIARDYPDTVAGENWRAHDRCFVVRTSDRTILVDTGIGPPGATVAEFLHPGGGALLEELQAAGADPASVDVVVITHMHFDHIGWNVSGGTDDPRPTFPRATYLLQRTDWDSYENDADPMGKPARDLQVRWLREAGVLELVDGGRELAEGVRIVPTPGHTAGSQSVEIRSGSDLLFLSGDVANHPMQVTNPEWSAFADADRAAAAATRREVFARAEHDGVIVGPSHFPQPFGRIVQGRWEPI